MTEDKKPGNMNIYQKLIEVRKLQSPCDANKNNVIELAKTTTNAVTGESLNIPDPTVIITLLEYVKMPTAIAIPPTRNNCCIDEKRNNPAIVISLKGDELVKTPITLPILFAPKL